MTGVGPEIPDSISEMFKSAARVSINDVPPVVREDCKLSLLDLLASCAAGKEREFWDIDTTDPVTATLSNAFRSHVGDFDPVHPRSHGHPAAMLFPALLPYYAVGECSSSDLITAYAIGHEVMCVLGDMAGRALREAHLHPTCLLGSIAVSVAVGRILGLSAEELSHAAFLAAATTTGYKASFGSEAKAFQLAVAARNGHTAAMGIRTRMVRLPVPGPSLSRVLHDSVASSGHLNGAVAPFAHPWRIEATPTFHKQLPVCGYLISTVLGFREHLRGGPLRSTSIESLHVRVPWQVMAVHRPGIPHSVDEARFNLGFLLSACVDQSIDDFESRLGDLLEDPAVVRLASSATVVHDADCDVDGQVRVTLRLQESSAVQLMIPVDGKGVLYEGSRVVTSKWQRHLKARVAGDLAERLAAATLDLETVSGPEWFGLLTKAVRDEGNNL